MEAGRALPPAGPAPSLAEPYFFDARPWPPLAGAGPLRSRVGPLAPTEYPQSTNRAGIGSGPRISLCGTVMHDSYVVRIARSSREDRQPSDTTQAEPVAGSGAG